MIVDRGGPAPYTEIFEICSSMILLFGKNLAVDAWCRLCTWPWGRRKGCLSIPSPCAPLLINFSEWWAQGRQRWPHQAQPLGMLGVPHGEIDDRSECPAGRIMLNPGSVFVHFCPALTRTKNLRWACLWWPVDKGDWTDKGYCKYDARWRLGSA